MLLTIDPNTMVDVLLEEYGPALVLSLNPMTVAEIEASEVKTELIPLVRHRFFIREVRPDGLAQRREDLEKRVVEEGRK